MHSLLEVAEAAAVVKHSWQRGVGDLHGAGFGALIIHQKTRSWLPWELLQTDFFSWSFSGCVWAELGAFVTILQVLMVPGPHLPLFGRDQTGKFAGWSSPELILGFPGGLQQGMTREWGVLTFLFPFPWREEALLFPAEGAVWNHCCEQDVSGIMAEAFPTPG